VQNIQISTKQSKHSASVVARVTDSAARTDNRNGLRTNASTVSRVKKRRNTCNIRETILYQAVSLVSAMCGEGVRSNSLDMIV
jgi:hypothetical protein